MGIIQKPAGPKDQTWATISSLWFGQLSPITCELNLCGQLWEFIAIAIKEDKAEHERDRGPQKDKHLQESAPQTRLGPPFPAWPIQKPAEFEWSEDSPGDTCQGMGGVGSVAFEWSNKHKRRQKCHFSRLPSKGSFEWISLVVGQHFKVLSGLLLKWLNAFRGLFVYVHVPRTFPPLHPHFLILLLTADLGLVASAKLKNFILNVL